MIRRLTDEELELSSLTETDFAVLEASIQRATSNGCRSADAEVLPKLTPIQIDEDDVLKPREWIVHDGWVAARKVTLVQGDGGDGKTPLLQQLQSSCATALPWIGLRVEECASLGIYTEDEESDLRLRQADIDRAYGQTLRPHGQHAPVSSR
jgi:hypothetical protein